MIKLIINCLFFVSIVSLPAIGQTSFNPRIGIKAGGALPFVGGVDKKANVVQQQVGFVGGLIIDLQIGDAYAISPEILYQSLRYEIEDDKLESINYLNIPILIRRKVDQLWSVYAGADFNMLIGTSHLDKATERAQFEKRFWGLTAGGRAYILDNLFIDLRAAIPMGSWSKVYPDSRLNMVTVAIGIDM